MGKTTLSSKYKLDRFSLIADDSLLLGIDSVKYKVGVGELFQSHILALFQSKTDLIIFFYLPVLGQKLVDLTINNIRYNVMMSDTFGHIHKYYISKVFKAGKLTITEYGFLDDSLIRSTLSTKEEHVFGVYNQQYFYDSKRYYQTQLIGELFYDLIDMRTIKDKIQDAFGRSLFYKDIASLNSNFSKIYYVAFNLFDQKEKKYFFPQDIVEMKVAYNEIRYVYNGKKVPSKEIIDPLKAGQTYISEQKQVIEKEKRKLQSGDRSDWNLVQNFFTYKQYQYDAIYKMSDRKRKVESAPDRFSYALVLGPKKGYRFAKEKFKNGDYFSYDYEETTLKNISIFHLTYQEMGHRYAVPLSSLVYESNKKSILPRFKNRLRLILKGLVNLVSFPINFLFGASGVLMKITRFIIKYWKWILAAIIVGLLLYVFLILRSLIN
jgi:hypothetical protein